MKQELISVRTKGKLANWYSTLDNKSYHVREAIRQYIAREKVNIDNYCLPKKRGGEEGSDEWQLP